MSELPFPKKIWGRNGMPEHIVTEMYEDYRRLHSLSACAKLHGRTRQAMFELFKSHGLPRYPKTFKPFIIRKGIKYTPHKDGYMRATCGHRLNLHHVIWIERRGPIPPGFQVSFVDRDKMNFRIRNLVCRPISEISSMHATGANNATRTAGARLGLLMKNFRTGKTSLTASIK